MNDNLKKIVFLSFAVIVAVFAISGGTYAYFTASSSAQENIIKGNNYQLNADLNISAIRKGNLIPVADSLIMTSLNGNYPCEDNRGYSLCSLYRVNLKNNGANISLNAYLLTNSGTTFTSNYLKYQLLTYKNNTYSSASDVNTLNITSGSKNYLKLSNNNISFPLNQGNSIEYYLVIWLSDPGNNNQLSDVKKVYDGSLVFESLNGGTVTGDFTS